VQACISVRIVVDASKRALARPRRRTHRGLVGEVVDPWATEEQFTLLRRYLDARHQGGGMSEMSMFDYVAMVEDSAVGNTACRVPPPNVRRCGRIIAVALTDVLSDGLSMVYSFFNSGRGWPQPRTYMVLDHIEQARGRGMPYVYLGYWIDGCQKMSYKARFAPLEARIGAGWAPLKRP